MTVNYSELENQLKNERNKVDVATVSFSVREIVRMFEEGEMSIAPSYQRKYRWKDDTASKFIESVFLGLPIPPIFVATNDDFQWEVVDGVQRISTLIRFLADNEDTLRKIGKETPLKLDDLSTLSQLNGTYFSAMEVSTQRYFNRQALQVISLTDKSDKDVRFDLFNRLNSGAIALSEQEVRTAVYRGPFIDFIERLSEDQNFSSLLKLQEGSKSDGTQVEQVLKFFAYKNDQESFGGAVKLFLNEYIGNKISGFEYKKEEELFRETFKILNNAMDNNPFLRKTTNTTPLVQFEACGIAIARIIAEGGEVIVPENNEWLDDSVLVLSSTGASNTRKKLRDRIERAKEIFSGRSSE